MVTTETLLTPRAPAAARAMARAGAALLASLDDEQRERAGLPFEGDERYKWTYTPVPQRGLQLKDMSGAQRSAAHSLIEAGLSARAAVTARQIIAHEAILHETERIENRLDEHIRDPELYSFAVFGTPGGQAPWGWRASGHHLALQFTVVAGDVVSCTPLFFGANPALVHHGAERGLRILAAEEDLARALLAGLEPAQKAEAIVDPLAPADILTKNYRVADPAAIPRGIAYAALSGQQRGQLVGLVRHYIERSTPELSAQAWQRVERAGLEAVTFAWAGPEQPGHGHYYAVKGPTFVIEYDNTQNQANHIHSVWRDFTNDWGADVLAEHYAHDGQHASGA
jgi:hypothetical protein